MIKKTATFEQNYDLKGTVLCINFSTRTGATDTLNKGTWANDPYFRTENYLSKNDDSSYSGGLWGGSKVEVNGDKIIVWANVKTKDLVLKYVLSDNKDKLLFLVLRDDSGNKTLSQFTGRKLEYQGK